jgi:hypothetical protein
MATFCLNLFHGSFIEHDVEHFADAHLNNHNAEILSNLKQQGQGQQSEKSANQNKKNIVPINLPDQPPQQNNHHHPTHPIAGLDCTAHGGPTDPNASRELVYWKDLPLDSQYTSPFRDPNVRRYLTFEPDGGGFNNIRMSMETVLGMAVATGRVLVLPPSQKMYLLGKDSFSFADFFPLHDMAQEHDGLEIISMKQFLEETRGKLTVRKSGEPAQIPNNVTEWDGNTKGVKSMLNPFLQSIAELPDWDPTKCMAGKYHQSSSSS